MGKDNRPKILFIGGTGTISTAVTELLGSEGPDLYLLNRGNRNERVPQGVKLIKGDIRDREKIQKTLSDYQFDVVVDWIAFTPEHVKNDVSLFSGKIKQYIFISSASAYEKPPSNYLIRETTPLVNPFWDYSRQKAACEELLLDEYKKNGFPCTIVRPSYTYYKTIPFILNSKTHPWTVVDRMIRGKKIIVPGDGTSLWTLTHASDFAKGFAGLLGNEKAVGEAFHITSDEVLTWNTITEAIADAVGVIPQIIHISSDFICFYEPEYIGGLHGDKAVSTVFDNSKIKKFSPQFSAEILFKDGIKESIGWFRSHPDLCSVDDEFNKFCDHLIEIYERGMVK
jgi:nucleoside-diphosphate-sugar epimerase